LFSIFVIRSLRIWGRLVSTARWGSL